MDKELAVDIIQATLTYGPKVLDLVNSYAKDEITDENWAELKTKFEKTGDDYLKEAGLDPDEVRGNS